MLHLLQFLVNVVSDLLRSELQSTYLAGSNREPLLCLNQRFCSGLLADKENKNNCIAGTLRTEIVGPAIIIDFFRTTYPVDRHKNQNGYFSKR